MIRRVAVLWLWMAAGCAPSPHPPPSAAAGAPPLPVRTLTTVSDAPRLAGTIAFHSDREGRNRLFAVDLASGEVRRLTTGREHHDQQPSWSPDGRRLAFVTTGFDRATYDIGVLELADGAVQRLTTHAAHDLHPVWTHDGASVLFSSSREGTQAIFRKAPGEHDAMRLSPRPHRALMATVSPDGRHVAYTQGTAEGLRVVVHDAATGAVRPVTPAGVDAADARWSPDGSRLAFAVVGGGPSAIGVVTGGGDLLQVLALEGRTVRTPSWSPDGRWLVAAATPDGREDWDLMLLTTDAEAAAYALTSGPANDCAPAWGPLP